MYSPIVDYTGMLRLKGVPFWAPVMGKGPLSFSLAKGVPFQGKVCERVPIFEIEYRNMWKVWKGPDFPKQVWEGVPIFQNLVCKGKWSGPRAHHDPRMKLNRSVKGVFATIYKEHVLTNIWWTLKLMHCTFLPCMVSYAIACFLFSSFSFFLSHIFSFFLFFF